MANLEQALLQSLAADLRPAPAVVSLLLQAIQPEPASVLREGGVRREHAQLVDEPGISQRAAGAAGIAAIGMFAAAPDLMETVREVRRAFDR